MQTIRHDRAAAALPLPKRLRADGWWLVDAPVREAVVLAFGRPPARADEPGAAGDGQA